MISARTTANLLAAAGVSGALVLYRFSPQNYSFYPRCPFFALTHHSCPGSGATSALAAPLHRRFSPALHFNAAVVLLLPIVAAYLAMVYWTAVRKNRIEWPQVPAYSWKFALMGIAVFGFARIFSQGSW